MTDYTQRALEVLAISDSGDTYRIERRCRTLPGDDDGSHYYCCLPDGRQVAWLGDGRYELPDGTVVKVVACQLRK
ncbi:hypothetical protein [Achromobacter sp. B7]|uniref:hypothetical protein n=1 Tax=Achromobacter sp. B7 TaxID=2282475 RepID=UPI0013C40BF1|nr:hypothetical protein [Achromobacter sp. B7]